MAGWGRRTQDAGKQASSYMCRLVLHLPAGLRCLLLPGNCFSVNDELATYLTVAVGVRVRVQARVRLLCRRLHGPCRSVVFSSSSVGIVRDLSPAFCTATKTHHDESSVKCKR